MPIRKKLKRRSQQTAHANKIFPADLVTHTEKICNGKIYFFVVEEERSDMVFL